MEDNVETMYAVVYTKEYVEAQNRLQLERELYHHERIGQFPLLSVDGRTIIYESIYTKDNRPKAGGGDTSRQ